MCVELVDEGRCRAQAHGTVGIDVWGPIGGVGPKTRGKVRIGKPLDGCGAIEAGDACASTPEPGWLGFVSPKSECPDLGRHI